MATLSTELARLRLKLLRRALRQQQPHRDVTQGAPGDRQTDWAAWQALVAEVRTNPDPVVAACAYCGRVPTLERAWRRPPAVLAAYLRHARLLSHSFCPGCLGERGLE